MRKRKETSRDMYHGREDDITRGMWIRLIKNKVLFFIIFIVPLIFSILYTVLAIVAGQKESLLTLNPLMVYISLALTEIVVYTIVVCIWGTVSDFIKGNRKERILIIILLIVFTLRAIAGYVRAR